MQQLEIQFFTDENHKSTWLKFLDKSQQVDMTNTEEVSKLDSELEPQSPFEGHIIDKVKITDTIFDNDEMVNFQPYSSVPNESIKKHKQIDVVIDGYLVCENTSKECFVIKPNLIYKIFNNK